jgi:hypothetical protein
MSSLASSAAFSWSPFVNPDASDHLARTMTLIDNALQGRARCVEVGRRVCEPAQARIAVRHDRCQWIDSRPSVKSI